MINEFKHGQTWKMINEFKHGQTWKMWPTPPSLSLYINDLNNEELAIFVILHGIIHYSRSLIK